MFSSGDRYLVLYLFIIIPSAFFADRLTSWTDIIGSIIDFIFSMSIEQISKYIIALFLILALLALSVKSFISHLKNFFIFRSHILKRFPFFFLPVFALMGISFMFDVSVPNPEQFMFISSDMIFHLIFSLAFALFAVIFIAPSEILFKHTPYTTSIERFCIVTRSVRQNYEELKLSVENQRGYVDISMDLDEEDIKEVLRIISKLRAGVHELAKLEKKKSIKLE
jgi:hypothetical protein